MSRIEIKEAALRSNIATIANIAPINKIYAVLKDNAYGHGLVTFATLCAKYGITKVVVRNADEADAISHIFGEVVCLAEQERFETAQNVCFAVNSIETLRRLPKNTKIHLKIDSGMHRCGIAPNEIYEALDYVIAGNIELCGVFSHLRSADKLSSESFWQEKNFMRIKEAVIDFCTVRGLQIPIFHLQNSAGLFRSGGLGDFDAARVGIAMYGYLDMPKAIKAPALLPVASLWADRISSRKLSSGALVGYGGAGKIEQDCSVSVYDVGYADGFPRTQPTGEYSLPGGKKLIGRVSMDNICVNGDDRSICVFDDASRVAKIYGTISYELLIRLNPKIKRVIV